MNIANLYEYTRISACYLVFVDLIYDTDSKLLDEHHVRLMEEVSCI